MNWDQIEIKWAEMTGRLQGDATKGSIERALDMLAPQDQAAGQGQPAPESDATPEAEIEAAVT